MIVFGLRWYELMPLNGNMYGMIVRAAASDATAVGNTETYMAGKSGVTL